MVGFGVALVRDGLAQAQAWNQAGGVGVIFFAVLLAVVDVLSCRSQQ